MSKMKHKETKICDFEIETYCSPPKSDPTERAKCVDARRFLTAKLDANSTHTVVHFRGETRIRIHVNSFSPGHRKNLQLPLYVHKAQFVHDTYLSKYIMTHYVLQISSIYSPNRGTTIRPSAYQTCEVVFADFCSSRNFISTRRLSDLNLKGSTWYDQSHS